MTNTSASSSTGGEACAPLKNADDCTELGSQFTCHPPQGGFPWAECVFGP